MPCVKKREYKIFSQNMNFLLNPKSCVFSNFIL
jgi:hypothetical protein